MIDTQNIENVAKSLAEIKGQDYNSLSLDQKDEYLNETLEYRRQIILN